MYYVFRNIFLNKNSAYKNKKSIYTNVPYSGNIYILQEQNKVSYNIKAFYCNHTVNFVTQNIKLNII